ncbi:MAG: IS110 family transposase [Actinomycetota bacterium]|nr:IS110 family transposase [Actinomycetota bacterium]
MDGSKDKPKMTAGLDLGDKYSYLCLIDQESGEVLEEGRLRTTPEALRRRFGSHEQPLRIAIEAGTHSPWVSRVLEECGHEVLVANARKLRLIYANKRKTDEVDAENLARLARLDPKLLYPLKHRGEDSQAHMAVVRSREALVSTRTQLVNHVRGAVKSFGARLPKCPARSFHKRASEHIPEALLPALGPILQTIGSLTERIREYDRKLEAISKEHYPQETELLRQVEGIGPLTALTFVRTLEDPHRFEKSRCVGAYLGLVPATDRSGDRDPQKRISKEGDEMLRKLLVGSAHYILGPFGSDSDLRRHGEKIASRGGKNAKKRAVVAVARKLAVLLHRLWVSAEVYEPLYNAHRSQEREEAA